jgi:DNA topoisomerase IB
VSATDPGWRRVRQGRGFRYLDEQGLPLDPAGRARVEALVIPPAWTDVWICPHPRGHLQAVGTDAAGRRQYLYHEDWRRTRDEAKFDRVLAMATELPRVRQRLDAELAADSADRRVLAMAVRLIDLGCFRVGSAGYTEENGSYGLTTLERRHVRRSGAGHVFTFVGKSGIEHRIEVDDADVCRVLAEVTRGRRAASRLLVVRRDRRFVPVSAAAVNEYLGDLFHAEVTAKDFRTWHGTVRVAAALGAVERAATRTRRDKQVRAAIVDAAEYLGNTPAVARSAYVDPRVIDLFEDGTTIAHAVRRASPDARRRQDQLDRATVRLLS